MHLETPLHLTGLCHWGIISNLVKLISKSNIKAWLFLSNAYHNYTYSLTGEDDNILENIRTKTNHKNEETPKFGVVLKLYFLIIYGSVTLHNLNYFKCQFVQISYFNTGNSFTLLIRLCRRKEYFILNTHPTTLGFSTNIHLMKFLKQCSNLCHMWY